MSLFTVLRRREGESNSGTGEGPGNSELSNVWVIEVCYSGEESRVEDREWPAGCAELNIFFDTTDDDLSTMSSATWRSVFTYVLPWSYLLFTLTELAISTIYRYNKYTQIAARAVRSSLKESERVNAEKRGVTTVRYQKWENGSGGPQVCPSPCCISNVSDRVPCTQTLLNPEATTKDPKKQAVV